MSSHASAGSTGRRPSAARATLENLLSQVGVTVNGDAPWDIRVHDQRFYEYVLTGGTLALGESYMDGWWDCERLDELVFRALRRDLDHRIVNWRGRLFLLEMKLRNLQTLRHARQVAEQHYDLGNHFFERMLGRTMNYSCGWFRDDAGLDAAQEAKMDLVARKLQLQRGDRVLDIGCGWGSMARFAAERYGCEVVGVTISREQLAYAQKLAKDVDFRLLDYRDPELRRLGTFDKIVSIGMFEHVGRRNYGAFFSMVQDLLADDGLFLLHTIFNDHLPAEPWINKYIFPNGMLPSQMDLARSTRGRFVVEDFHNFGAHYDRTLMAWYENYSRYEAEPEFPYPLRFKRMWRYYLLTYAGSFRSRRRNHLGQIVMSRRGMLGGYTSVR